MSSPAPRATQLDVDVVIPTIGRPSLGRLLDSLAACTGPTVGQVLLVDDRRDRGPDLLSGGDTWRETWLDERVKVVTGRAAGPASARNDGWRAATAPWIAFLDDDVLLPPEWLDQLAADLQRSEAGEHVAGSQGRIRVPVGERPTDWERNVKGLESARWATADLAYRRRVLAAVGGFDERFPRAYREDADIGLRIVRAGWSIESGEREIIHPVPPAPWSVSVTKQAGNADDPLMDRLHGPGWREDAAAPPGRRRLHLATVVAGGIALAGAASRDRRVAALGAAAWGALTARFAQVRLAGGPRTLPEVAGVVATSALIPPVAVRHWAAGVLRARRLVPAPHRPPAVDVVLFDRDGTLVVDVPYNGDPAAVQPVPGAAEALDRLRAAGVRVGIVSNQSGIARGVLDVAQVEAVNERVVELVGPFEVVTYCPHGPDDGCSCRKPRPGMVLEAAARFGVEPARVAVVGDIGTDVEAARAAGAVGVMVPTDVTLIEEVEAADAVFAHLGAAVDHLLGGRSR